MLELEQPGLFDYDSLDESVKAIILELDTEMDLVLKRTAKEIGLILLKAKEGLPHGMYMAWVASKGLSETTAWRCIQVAQGKELKSFIMKDLSVEVMDQPVEPVKANERVGNSPSIEDRRETVKIWFDEYPSLHHLSDREIAKRCGVDHKTVGKIRKELYPKPAPIQEVFPVVKVDPTPAQEIPEVEAAREEQTKQEINEPLSDTSSLPKIEPSEEAKQEREMRRAQVQERNEQLKAKGADIPTGKYACLVVDPPWPMQKIEREERPNQFEFDYPTMSEDELRAFQLPALAATDCHMYLWTTQKYLPMAMRLADNWGFKYQCLMTWVKNVGITPFSWMYSTEHVLFCTRGSLPLLALGKRLDFSAKVREHSRKPDEFYELVREVSPGPRLDVFSREKRDGFEQYGNEVEKYVSAR